MPDLDQIKQGEQGARDRRGRFAKGRSGNPAGRPRGCRDHVNRAARLLLAGEGEALTRKAVELALAGDPAALRLCLERIVGPYRERAVEFTMPPIRNAADLAGAMAAVADAAAEGAVTPREAMQLGHRRRGLCPRGRGNRVRAALACAGGGRCPACLILASTGRRGGEPLAPPSKSRPRSANVGIWRAEAAMGTVIRSALARAGVDAAQATRLRLADEAAAALAALSDTPELQRVDSDGPAAAEDQDRVRGDDFEPKIRAMARSFADAPPTDFAKASFAELLCLVARPATSGITLVCLLTPCRLQPSLRPAGLARGEAISGR